MLPGIGVIVLAVALVAWPRPVAAQPAGPVAPGAGHLGAHVVQPGESLYVIAARYGMSPSALARLNATRTSSLFLPGRTLWVPLGRAVNARAGVPAAVDGGVGSSDGGDLGRRATSRQGGATYDIQPGDTLYAIAGRFGVDVEDLKRWNGLPIDGSIRAGDTLVVVGDEGGEGDGGAATPEFVPPASSAGGAADGRSAAGAATTEVHTVAAGETLTSIAGRYGITANELARLNGLADADVLQPGQVLAVPARGAGPENATGAKRIEVDVSEQRMYVWQGDTLVWNFVTSTGLPGYPTRRGTFAVQSKIPNAWSTAWQLWMPSWLGIYWAGGSENGIHALPIVNGRRLWGGYLGSPISYGCVVLDTADAERLYAWAEIGTKVVIRD